MSRALVYARHGREHMGCKFPVRESDQCRETGYIRLLAEGKSVSVRGGLEEAGAQSYEPTNRNSIKGHYPGKSAPYAKSH